MRLTYSNLCSYQIRLLFIPIGLAMACLVFPLHSHNAFTSGEIACAQQSADGFDDELRGALDLLAKHKYEDAIKSFKHANDLRGKTSAECFLGMAEAYSALGAYKNVIESCKKAIEFSGDNKHLQALARNIQGVAIRSQSGSKDQEKLQDAEQIFRLALTADDKLYGVHFNLGVTLMQENRDADGIVELKKYLELDPDASNAAEAKKMIENPRRARETYAPDFSLTTATGEFVSLEDLHGKVVLLDFWGTWCGPCVASVPELRELRKKYAKESAFVMIGISSDIDEQRWRSFTEKNQMIWLQDLDRERRIQRAFGVHAFPTYIVIDAEGIEKYRGSGLGPRTSSELEDAIKKQLKNLAKAPVT